MFFPVLFLVATINAVSGQSISEAARVAVASNFVDPIVSVTKLFETRTDYKMTLIFGSTGKLYAQIKNGAPFDAFFAADIFRPELLEEEGIALPGSRFTYAFGKLILWSGESKHTLLNASILQRGKFRHLAIANPKFAPYGKAAREVLQALGVWEILAGSIVRGENIRQTFQFIISGNAELGFVSYSQIKSPSRNLEGSFWEVPQSLYTPIEQQAVLIRSNEAARAFLSFIKRDEALEIIREYGYDTP